MQTKEFLHQLDHEAIVKAITAAESQTSGELRVFVSRRAVEDAVLAAQAEFHRLQMDRTASRNGVLIYVAPKSQTFAIIGDQGIHERCGQPFWGQVAEAMLADFRAGQFTQGVVRGIEEAAKTLKVHFPRHRDDVNELPNRVEGD